MNTLHRTEPAAITVYLSLILMLILSLVFTIIEGARISTASVFAERALSTSTDSVLAGFYDPLWEEYHLFAYDAKEGDRASKAERIEEALTDYISYTLAPGKDITLDKKDTMLNLLGISLDTVSAEEQTRLMDYEGQLLINEAVEYEKYEVAADGLETLLNKFSLLEKPKKVSAVYEDRLEAEEKLAEIDRSVLRLMELLDGLKTSKKGISLTKKGKLQIKEYFVKQLYLGKPTSENCCINNAALFEAIKNYYINPSDIIRPTKDQLTELEALKLQLQEIGKALISNSEELANAQSQLGSVGNGGNLTKEEKAQRKEINHQIEGIRAARDSLLTDQAELESRKQKLMKLVRASCHTFTTTIKEIIPLTQEAIQVMDKIISGASVAEPLIEKYERRLIEVKDLGEDIASELADNLAEMKRYTAKAKGNQSYSSMKMLLQDNLNILQETKRLLDQCEAKLNTEEYSSGRNLLDTVLMRLEGYHVKELSLDYSTLVLEKVKTEDPVEAVKNTVNSGLTGLVIDLDTISNKELTEGQLPSLEAAMMAQESDFEAVMTEFIKNFSIDGNTSGMQGIFKGFSDTGQLLNTLGDGINQVSEHLLFQEYLKKHFETYPVNQEDVTKRKPSALTYEQEYLLTGALTDQENLSTMVGKIIFLRMVMNFVSILGDKVKGQEALAAATALVGFTGFPILISITKTLLLIVWAFAEALVDVCALMQGKEVSFLKKQIVLTFPEIFLLNRSYLQSKVPLLEKSKMSFSYQDYLRLFLLLKKKKDLAYRSMDLIQENINLRYEEAFYFTNCLYGFQTRAEFSVNTKFIAIPMIRNYLNHNIKGYSLHYQTENSY